MEFSVQTSLFSYIIARLGGILEKSNDPSDTGRYIILKTHNKNIKTLRYSHKPQQSYYIPLDIIIL